MKQTHQTALTQDVEANGIRFAYRRFGKAGPVPLVSNMHFSGTMDHWDPAVTDSFAKDGEVISFNNAGLQPSRKNWLAYRPVTAWFVGLLWAPGLDFRDSDLPRRRALLRSRGETR